MAQTNRIKHNVPLLIILTFGFFLVSCEFLLQEDEAIIGYEDLYEPNNVAREATEVMLGTSIQASIQVNGDEDYYTFLVPDSLPGEGYVLGELSPFPGKPYLTFYNEQKQTYGSQYNYNLTKGADLSGWISVIPGKRYYVNVKDFSSSGKSEDPYTLNLQYFYIDDPYEPDNKLEEATEAELDSVYQAYLFKAGSNNSDALKDFYKFTLPVDGNIQVSLTSFPTNLRPQFWVIGSNGESISSFNYSTTKGADLIKTFEGLKAGVIYISVGFFGSSGSLFAGEGSKLPDNMTNAYSLKVSM